MKSSPSILSAVVVADYNFIIFWNCPVVGITKLVGIHLSFAGLAAIIVKKCKNNLLCRMATNKQSFLQVLVAFCVRLSCK